MLQNYFLSLPVLEEQVKGKVFNIGVHLIPIRLNIRFRYFMGFHGGKTSSSHYANHLLGNVWFGKVPLTVLNQLKLYKESLHLNFNVLINDLAENVSPVICEAPLTYTATLVHFM